MKEKLEIYKSQHKAQTKSTYSLLHNVKKLPSCKKITYCNNSVNRIWRKYKVNKHITELMK